MWVPGDADGQGPVVGTSVREPDPAGLGLGAFLWPIGAGSSAPLVSFVWRGCASARVGRDLHTSWWDRVESPHSDKGQTVSREGRGGRDTRGSCREGGGMERRDASASGQGWSLPGPCWGATDQRPVRLLRDCARGGNSLSPEADISPGAWILPQPGAAGVLAWLCAKFAGKVELCSLSRGGIGVEGFLPSSHFIVHPPPLHAPDLCRRATF